MSFHQLPLQHIIHIVNAGTVSSIAPICFNIDDMLPLEAARGKP
jgi:hypothetical protein